MNRVTTFSTCFPSYHPKKGQPTFFVEKILYGLIRDGYPNCYTDLLKSPYVDVKSFENITDPKWHTIRAGHRYKVGDFLIPRIWTGKPYRSKQYQFAPPIEIKKVWDFSILWTGIYQVGTRQFDGEVESHHELLEQIAKNDGLSDNYYFDLMNWFRGPFYGQIISWNADINY